MICVFSIIVQRIVKRGPSGDVFWLDRGGKQGCAGAQADGVGRGH